MRNRINAPDENFSRSIGLKIVSARKRAGLTQVRLAELAEMSDWTLWRIEHGITAPYVTTLKRIADTLGCDIKDFL